MTTSHKMRRQPKQTRGQQRIEKILDATESLLCEMDFDKITTNHIAQKANTSVGVMYRYFPNKYAVFAGLAERDVAFLINLQFTCLTKCNKETWQEHVCIFVDELAAHYKSKPAYNILWSGLKANNSTKHIETDMLDQLVDSHLTLSKGLMPNLSEEAQQVAASVIVNLIQSQLNLAIRETNRGEQFYQSMMNECKTLLVMYMGRLIHQSDSKPLSVISSRSSEEAVEATVAIAD